MRPFIYQENYPGLHHNITTAMAYKQTLVMFLGHARATECRSYDDPDDPQPCMARIRREITTTEDGRRW